MLCTYNSGMITRIIQTSFSTVSLMLINEISDRSTALIPAVIPSSRSKLPSSKGIHALGCQQAPYQFQARSTAAFVRWRRHPSPPPSFPYLLSTLRTDRALIDRPACACAPQNFPENGWCQSQIVMLERCRSMWT